MRAMKKNILIGGLFLAAAAFTFAATNDLTTTLQRGLFEEEANQNLTAAIAAYQSVAAQFDKDRKLAATAVFRLGECYRKQGDTNHAAAQYERVLRDFSDQAQLATLSRQNLAGLGAPAATSAPPSLSNASRQEQKRLLEEEIKLVEMKLADQQRKIEVGAAGPDVLWGTQRDILNLKRQLAALDAGQPLSILTTDASAGAAAAAAAESLALEAQVAELESLPEEKLRIEVQQSFPNPVLTSLMQKLTEAEQSVAGLQKDYGPQHAEVVKAVALTETINKQIDAQVEAVLRGLNIKRLVAKKTAEALQAQVGAAAPKKEAASSSTAAPATASEAEEVKRIQAMIKDSPDLINAKDATGGAYTPLHMAANRGQLVVAQFLLANGAEVDAKNNSNETPLHVAARGGHKAMVELLLSHKANVKAADNNGQTPLHLAAGNGFRSVAEVLLAHGADVNAKTGAGSTPLLMAAANGFRSVAELLLAHGADPNASTTDVRSSSQVRYIGTPLHVAAVRGDVALMELLLANKSNISAATGYGRTPLDVAAGAGNLAIASTLLSHGADVNAKNSGTDSKGWTPLHYAVNSNQKEMVALLLKNKADPNARIETSFGEGGKGYTSLLMATAKALPDVVDLLLASGADPNLRNATRVPILNAMYNENPAARLQMLKSLIQHGGALESRDSFNNTPLLLAAGRADKEAMVLLLANKADVNAQDQNGYSPLRMLVEISQNQDIKPLAELLLAAGADVNARNANGSTPLHLAVQKGKQDLIELLLANKADPNARNNTGQTPLDLAERKGLPSPAYWPPGQPAMPIPSPVQMGTPLPGVGSSQPAPASATSIADLLRQHGATHDLPRLDRIEVRRPSAGYSATVFTQSTNEWNQFSLLELVAVYYGLLAASPGIGQGDGYDPGSFFLKFGHSLPFPDLARLRIRRPAPDGKIWQEQAVDLTPVLGPGECSKDVRLRWGDVVDVPEADHRLSEVWAGFPTTELANLKQCLTRQVEVVIKGQTTNITLAPSISISEDRKSSTLWPDTSFWILPALRASGLLLASSDISRVKLTRRDPATGQSREWVVDCGDSNNPPALWLRDGDVIEVPEK